MKEKTGMTRIHMHMGPEYAQAQALVESTVFQTTSALIRQCLIENLRHTAAKYTIPKG